MRALIKWLICFDLQDKTCCRLTLFNARRGGKPAQLHLSDWADSCNKVWFDMCDTEKFSRTVLLLLRELSLSDISWSFSVSMYFCVSGIFCVTERNKLSDINDNKHATIIYSTSKGIKHLVHIIVPPAIVLDTEVCDIFQLPLRISTFAKINIFTSSTTATTCLD